MERQEEIFFLIEAFLAHLRTLHRAPGTLLAARRCLNLFSRYMEAEIGKAIRSVTKSDLEGYVRYLLFRYRPARGENLAPASAAQGVSFVKQFFRWLVKEKRLLVDPACGISPPRVEKFPKRVLTPDEVDRLLSAPNPRRVVGLRDRAILELSYSTGLRLSELVNLNVMDLDLKERLLRVNRGKGGKDRVIPFGKAAAFFLNRYLKVSRPVLRKRPVEALFLSRVGNRFDGSEIRRMFQKYRKRAGLAKPFSAHTLRHTCATHLLEGGADIRYIQELLGHASPATTQVYARSSVTHLADVLRKHHPRGKFSAHTTPSRNAMKYDIMGQKGSR